MQAGYFGFGYSDSYTSPDMFAKVQSGIVEIRSTDQWKAYMDSSKQNDKLLVIEFTAMDCKPCKIMEQDVKAFAAMYSDVDFIKIDVDNLPSVAWKFNVCTMPSFVVVKEGIEIDRVQGVKPIELQNKIEKHTRPS